MQLPKRRTRDHDDSWWFSRWRLYIAALGGRVSAARDEDVTDMEDLEQAQAIASECCGTAAGTAIPCDADVEYLSSRSCSRYRPAKSIV